MGLVAEGLKGIPLREDLSIEVTGVVTFFDDAEPGGSIVYI